VSTGSKFVTELEQNNTDLVDMEAYWIAMACYKCDVQFLCYKYVSDYIGNNSFTEWENRVGESHRCVFEIVGKTGMKFRNIHQ
jgi:nucleoside phosphorylase